MPRIFLSPLIKQLYRYPNGGDERHWMNRLADEMLPYLERMGVSWERPPQNMGLRAAIDMANAARYDLYLSLGTSGSPEELEGRRKGASFRYCEHSVRGKQAAMLLSENFKKVYPQPELVSAESATTFLELTGTVAPAVLVTVTYHDNPQDEIWLTTNLADIAKNLSESIGQLLNEGT